MKLHDTVPGDGGPLFDDSFRAWKSFLFVDNQVIALGSGIANDDTDYPTITTLFQSTTSNGTAEVDGAVVEGAHLERYEGGLFADPQGNYYVVSPGQSVILEQSEQSSLVPQRIAEVGADGSGPAHLPVSAPHAKAWLDHGTAPNEGFYEYLILIQGDRETAAFPLRKPQLPRAQTRRRGAHCRTRGQGIDRVCHFFAAGRSAGYGPKPWTHHCY